MNERVSTLERSLSATEQKLTELQAAALAQTEVVNKAKELESQHSAQVEEMQRLLDSRTKELGTLRADLDRTQKQLAEQVLLDCIGLECWLSLLACLLTGGCMTLVLLMCVGDRIAHSRGSRHRATALVRCACTFGLISYFDIVWLGVTLACVLL